MALFQVNYPSTVINKFMTMNVILPDENVWKYDQKGKYPVVYLLHGYTDDYSKWLRLTSIERYANEMGIAVVMPDAGKSFYADMAYGDPYFTHITQEIPEYVQKWFPISDEKDFNFVAGLSMGGYGAMKLAVNCPNQFKAVGTFSGALALAQTATQEMPDEAEEWLKRSKRDAFLAFGDMTKVEKSMNDVFWMLSELKRQEQEIPNIYVSCGTDDFIYEQTVAFSAHLKALKIPFTYFEEPETHNWGFWDREVLKFLKWIQKI